MSNFYRAFEDRHRGSRELIKSRLAVYHPFLAPLPAVGRPTAIDLGCGRGEWLELLGELGFAARGIDLDEGMLAACRERGLDVSTADALSSLRTLPDASVTLVSAFHLVEHIPFDDVQELIAQALRVLQPGGLLILETPNPENLVVGSTNFYTDPSHLRPVPPLLLDFAVEFTGFARHKVVRLQEPAALLDASEVELINVLNGVSPDYSVIGQKAADAAVLGAFDAAFAAPFGLELGDLAQRYEETLRAREAAAAAALAKLEERVAAAEQGPAQLFQRALDTIGEAQAATRVSHEELMASHERERAQRELAQGHAAAAARLDAQLQQMHDAKVEAEARAEQARNAEAEARDRAEQARTAEANAEARAEQARTAEAEAEARAEQARLAKAEAEVRAAQAEALADRVAEEMRAARSEAEARAVQADAQSRFEQAQAAHADAEAQLQQMRHQLEAMTSRASAAEQTVMALYASTSWRISAPLRGIKRLGRGLPQTPQSLRGKSKGIARKLLQWSIRKVLKHRRLTEFALGMLARHPALKARLRRVATAQSFAPVPEASPIPIVTSATPMIDPNQPHLTVRAARLLSDMQKASSERGR
ncbi:methyltransferase domain-containing protein [Massilia sp. IC2-278]|uniref:class I SAM-dependent methyltransferase n=1 Tax=Massilia sp. IC2-278 TaxID=2887200 RepID=UPI001E48C427|nr:methyltransferase domain-containing protein [Massilia sp. IC2-278]MCC2960806.1 methyltransferase domain-containing protein [Massilia sp. IC2-278]